MVFITTHDTIMNEQQLMKTIEDQNKVIIAKDATIELLRKQLGDAKSELNELYSDRSWQKMQREYLTEAMWQKSVKIIDGFEYGVRYIPLSGAVALILGSIACMLFMLSVMGIIK